MLKNKKFRVIFTAILFVIMLCIGAYGFYTSKNNVDKDTESSVESSIQNSGTVVKSINIYKTENNEVDLYIDTSEENYYSTESKYELINQYSCNNINCTYHELYDEPGTNIIIRDNGYYVYNYISKELKKLNISNKKYNSVYAARYNNKSYGYLFVGEDEAAYYSLTKNKEYLFDSYYDTFNNLYIFKNGDKYISFNFVDEKYTTIGLENDDYKQINFVPYDNKVYGYSLQDSNEKTAFYSVKDKKTTMENIDQSISHGFIDGSATLLYNNIILDDVLYNYSTGEAVHDFKTQYLSLEDGCDNINCYSVYPVGNEKTIYYGVTSEDDMDYSTYFFDENYNLMFSGQRFAMYDVTSDGNLIVVEFNEDYDYKTYKIYDKTGTLIFTSKTYKSIELIDRGYIGVVDTDNYLKLLDYSGNVVKNIVKMNSNLIVHSALSGYYSYKGIEGIFIVVEDKSIGDATEFEEGGYGYEYYYDFNTKKVGKLTTEIGGYGKPVLYLYPKTKTNITVDFAKKELLTTTYPKFKDKWTVTAYPSGDLYDKSGRYYYGLYWEESGTTNVDFKEGFYVTKDNAIEFLENKLTEIGLNERESNEFIMYWLPILEKNGKNLVYFELTESRQKYNKLIINPKPDSLLRVAIHVKKVNHEIKIKEQKIPKFERKGFTAIEWGGVTHN